MAKKNRQKRSEQDLLDDLVQQIECLKRFLNLGEWEGKYKFTDMDSSACITANLDYLCYEMEFDREYVLGCLQEKEFNKLTGTVLHELCHLVIDPVYFLAIDMHGGASTSHVTFPFIRQRRENAVERVSRIAQQTLPESLYINIQIEKYDL